MKRGKRNSFILVSVLLIAILLLVVLSVVTMTGDAIKLNKSSISLGTTTTSSSLGSVGLSNNATTKLTNSSTTVKPPISLTTPKNKTNVSSSSSIVSSSKPTVTPSTPSTQTFSNNKTKENTSIKITPPTKNQSSINDSSNFSSSSIEEYSPKILNLEVVFYNVTTCYVAENCTSQCDVIRDYRDGSVLFEFENGTLRTVDKFRADSYNWGIRRCLSSSFKEKDIQMLESYIFESANFFKNWTNGSLQIVPHFRFVSGDMGCYWPLLAEGGITGYQTGCNPPVDQYAEYARQAIDPGNMDLFVAFTNPFPDTGSENDGFIVQSYIAETSGIINGVSPVKISGMATPTSVIGKDFLVAAIIHEITHAINIGHYMSGYSDVYGIENSEQGEGYNPVTNPRPQCTETKHYVGGLPNPYAYFPDSYNWLDPMWNSKPFEPYPESGAVSYCLSDASIYPDINPLDFSDNYSDLEEYSENMKYYKFVYQMHWQKNFTNLETSLCKNKRLDKYTLDYRPPQDGQYEYFPDVGGGCYTEARKCDFKGLCFDLVINDSYPKDVKNKVPLLSASSINKVDSALAHNSKILVSGESFFSNSNEIAIISDVVFSRVDVFQPIILNPGRYALYVNGKSIFFEVLDGIVPKDGNYQSLSVEVPSLEVNKNYEIASSLKNGQLKLYLNGKQIGSTSEKAFLGKFRYQEVGTQDLQIYVGYNNGNYFHGQINEIKFYNKVPNVLLSSSPSRDLNTSHNSSIFVNSSSLLRNSSLTMRPSDPNPILGMNAKGDSRSGRGSLTKNSLIKRIGGWFSGLFGKK